MGVGVVLVPVKKGGIWLLPASARAPRRSLGRKHWEQGILCPQPQHSQDRGGGLGVPRRGPAGLPLTFGQMGREKGN